MARLLSRGCTGLDVNELQAALNFHLRRPYTPLKPDGIFGPLTDARVREFQKRAGLKADGLVGPKTVAALYAAVAGAVDVQVKVPAQSAGRGTGAAFGPRLPGFRPPVLASPTIPLPPPQVQTAASSAFELKSELLFNPLAKPSQGVHIVNFSLTLSFPWPTGVPKPLKLTVEPDGSDPTKPKLDAKLKLPFNVLTLGRFELNPYFFVGGGMDQNHFTEVNVGAGSEATFRLFRIPGTQLGVEAVIDGGSKWKHDLDKNKSEMKWFFQGGLGVAGSF